MDRILPLLHGPGDGGERGELWQARYWVQALLVLQASLVLWGQVPERGLEVSQKIVRAAGASAGRRREARRGTCSRGLAFFFAVEGAHERADGLLVG